MTENLHPQAPISLADLHPGALGTILSIRCCGPLRRKLMDMGLTPGTEVYLEGAAPLGDPIIINARGCRLALRRGEASSVLVAPRNVPSIVTVQRPGRPRGRRSLGRGFGRRHRGRRNPIRD
jgi:ferrous iron transport protein A